MKTYNPVYPNAYKTLALDFDRVIHRNSMGFHDGTVYDEPVDGVKDALEVLSKYYIIVIYTCKARLDRPLVNGKTGSCLIWEWLEKHDLAKYIKEVTATKPVATLYVDDKGVTFTNWNDVLDKIIIHDLIWRKNENISSDISVRKPK